MRITHLEILNFRAFAGQHSLDLDADAVIVVAGNGQGKTSLFDAILWALSGAVPRLGHNDAQLRSLYADSVQIQVSIGLRSESGEAINIRRSSDGERQHLEIERQLGSVR